MSRLSCAAFPPLVTMLLLASVFSGETPAQGLAEPELVNITTADGVKLKGAFYKSAKMTAAPTVIMLHPIGDGKSMQTKEWKSLAEALQKANYSVMMFDFRGHGDSTTIDKQNLFWAMQANVTNVKTKNKAEIEVKDYIKQGGAYLPVLVNDIAAVRAYLDSRNDDIKDCNTSSIIVIGADAGATLGALWINSEWYRYKFTPDKMYPLAFEIKKASNYSDSAGNNIIGAVFLTIQPALEKRKVRLESLLKIPCKDNAMATLFFCGKEDTKSWGFAKDLETKLRVKGSAKHQYIGVVDDLKTNLTGLKLLQPGLKSNENIVKYLDSFVDDRKVVRTNRNAPNAQYRWSFPNGMSLPARTNKEGESTLFFDDYLKFIPQ